jgi:hypothetical protein
MPVTGLRSSGIPAHDPLTKAAFAMLLAATAEPVVVPRSGALVRTAAALHR